jgi:CRP/FNR family transcriptional regulator, polysaccharide utilization system transcription regulator
MKTVLLIEDNKEVRENIAEILDLANYKVLAAENGKSGADLAKKNKPDLIICDIMMPELDGYGVLHILSKDPSTASIPFIFLTAKSEKDDFRKGMKLGADDYLTKPFDDIELLNAIETRLKKNEIIKSEFKNTVDGLNEFVKEARGFAELDKLTSDIKKLNTFKKKRNIYEEGRYPNSIYFIHKGKVKTFKTNDQGNELITGLYKEGDFLGYADILQGSEYNESAEALEDSEICIIQKDDFFSLIESNRDVANKFIKMLSNNVVEKEEKLLQLAYNSVRKRVAEALLNLEKRYKESGDTKQFNMAIAREDLANIVGSSKETVIRTLSDFKDERLIDIKGSNIILLDSQKLARLKN